MIRVREQAFEINGEKIFIFGGELHYFRVPKEDWEDRIKKVKEAGCNLISTYIPWMWHETEEGNIDLTGHTTPERDLAAFLDLVKKHNLFCMVRPGPYVMSELKNHGIPFWINEKYPEVVARKQNGRKHPTDVVSYMHPVFLEKVEKWYEAVCEVVGPRQISEGGSVIMFQLDNEVGMLQWITNQADYNIDTLTRFVDYIKGKYSIDQANNTLSVNIKAFEDLIQRIKYPTKKFAIKIQNEFMFFMREYYLSYIETLKNIALSQGINVPFLVNIHGFDQVDYAKRGRRYPIGVSQLYRAVKAEGIVAAGDYYIGNIVHDNFHDIVLANAFTTAVQNKEQPLFSAEFQGGFQSGIPRLQPTTFDLTTRLCIANGMNSLNYYMFAGGENYEDIGLMGRRHDWQAPVGTDGTLKKHYYTIQYLGNVIKAIEKDLLASKRDVVTFLGFYADYYMTEYSNKLTNEMYQEMKVFRDAFLYNGIGRGLTLNNITYEGYDIKGEDRIDPEKIKSLWMLSCRWMDGTVQNKLVKYVKDGGKLVLFPAVPTMDMKGNPCTILADTLGIEVKDRFWHQYVVIDGVSQVGGGYIETYNGENLREFAWLEKNPDDICGFEKEIGRGKIVITGIGIELEHYFKDEIIKGLAEKVDNLPVTSRNDYIDVSYRSVPGTDTTFMFIHNYDEYEKTMALDYFGKPLFDKKEITIGAKTGLILPINYKLDEKTTLIYSTCEIIRNEKTEIEVFCRQNNEILKFNTELEIIPQLVEYEIINEDGDKKLIIKNSLNKKVKISFIKG